MRLLLIAAIVPVALGAQSAAVARINVTPAVPVATVGQTLQLRADAVDSAGRPVADATIRFQRSSGIFEGGVDQNGLVSVGAPGTLVVTVSAMVTGQRPVIRRVSIPIQPGPAASIEVEPAVKRILVGQEVRLNSIVRSAGSDVRADDQVNWSSSSERVARVRAGALIGLAPGTATLTGTVGAATRVFSLKVIAGNVKALKR